METEEFGSVYESHRTAASTREDGKTLLFISEVIEQKGNCIKLQALLPPYCSGAIKTALDPVLEKTVKKQDPAKALTTLSH